MVESNGCMWRSYQCSGGSYHASVDGNSGDDIVAPE